MESSWSVCTYVFDLCDDEELEEEARQKAEEEKKRQEENEKFWDKGQRRFLDVGDLGEFKTIEGCIKKGLQGKTVNVTFRGYEGCICQPTSVGLQNPQTDRCDSCPRLLSSKWTADDVTVGNTTFKGSLLPFRDISATDVEFTLDAAFRLPHINCLHVSKEAISQGRTRSEDGSFTMPRVSISVDKIFVKQDFLSKSGEISGRIAVHPERYGGDTGLHQYLAELRGSLTSVTVGGTTTPFAEPKTVPSIQLVLKVLDQTTGPNQVSTTQRE